ALEWAVAEAKLRHDHLLIVSCWEYPMLIASEVVWVTPPNSGELIAAAVARAERLISELKINLTEVPYDIVSPEGRAGAELVRLAAEADLLVLGSRGAGSAREMLLGSVSNYCAHHSTCPVVIIRPPA
ncbi:MAG: universal stress protein, partial [Actinobacteria bacterium]|nr:universal stress protein [Actinomycetota bacterium]